MWYCNHRYKKYTCVKCGNNRATSSKHVEERNFMDEIDNNLQRNITQGIINNPKYIKDWEELKNEESRTHVLKIDMEYGCGRIEPKEKTENGWNGIYYLSTHTFYGSNHELSTKILQSFGFNVTLANWDE